MFLFALVQHITDQTKCVEQTKLLIGCQGHSSVWPIVTPAPKWVLLQHCNAMLRKECSHFNGWQILIFSWISMSASYTFEIHISLHPCKITGLHSGMFDITYPIVTFHHQPRAWPASAEQTGEVTGLYHSSHTQRCEDLNSSVHAQFMTQIKHNYNTVAQ